MKIVNIFGGLGNQMFQYALIKALEERFHETVFADTHLFSDYSRHNGLEIERIFPILLQEASKKEIKDLAYYSSYYNIHKLLKWLHIKKKTTIQETLSEPYHEDVFRNGSFYYDGYWQDPRYFERVKLELMDCFQFKIPLSTINQETCDSITAQQSVGIHVRRGDYLKKTRYRGICDIDYYKQAIQIALHHIDHPHFYIFSNDIDWCHIYLTPLFGNNEYSIIDWNKGTNSYIDMQLMSKCKSLIIANSSFSWWAAYLNKTANYIIAPKVWFNATPALKVQLDSWLLI